MSLLQVEGAVETFNITCEVDNTTSARHTQKMDCIRLDVLALAVTQFKPSKRKGGAALLICTLFHKVYITIFIYYHIVRDLEEVGNNEVN